MQAVASPLIAAAKASPPPPLLPTAAEDADLEWQEWHAESGASAAARSMCCGSSSASAHSRMVMPRAATPATTSCGWSDGRRASAHFPSPPAASVPFPPYAATSLQFSVSGDGSHKDALDCQRYLACVGSCLFTHGQASFVLCVHRLLDDDYSPSKDPAVCSKCNTLLTARFFGVEPRLRRGRRSACLSCLAAARRRLSRRGHQIPAQKACSSCHEQKPAASFSRCRRSPDGLQSKCKSCQALREREARAKEPLIRWPITEQRCMVCGDTKPAVGFGQNSRARTGLRSTCKQCHRNDTQLRRRLRREAQLSREVRLLSRTCTAYGRDKQPSLHCLSPTRRACGGL